MVRRSSRQGEGPKLSEGGWLIPDPICADLNIHVGKLDLSARAGEVLSLLGIETVQQLVDFPRRGLQKSPNFGKKSDLEIQQKVFRYLSGKGIPQFLDVELGTTEFVERLLSTRAESSRRVLRERFGLWDGNAKTLQHIAGEMDVTKERVRQIEARALNQLRNICDRDMIERFIRGKISAYLRRNSKTTQGVLRKAQAAEGLADGCSPREAVLAMAFFQELYASEVSILTACLIEAEKGVFCVEQKVQQDYLEVRNLVMRTLRKRQEAQPPGALLRALYTPMKCLDVPDTGKLLFRVLAISPSLIVRYDGKVALSRRFDLGPPEGLRMQ